MPATRRNFLQMLGLGSAGAAIGSALPFNGLAQAAGSSYKDQQLFIGENIAVTSTTNGKVRGYVLREIYTFLGIPYGADTSGANRFMPPKKPTPWTETKPAVWWGNSAPQILEKRYADANAAFLDHWNYDDVSENCLNLNVWTPSISDNKKRPVLVWLHGGGYTSGNSHEHDGYTGENFSRFGDVVFCSVNHRLGAMGFSNFGGVSKEFASSANVGMLDIVAALEWVRDNIANFGGDPSNVTIMGQSGGGGKVCTLTAMPSAKGLFHKAVALSGSAIRSGNREASEKLGSYILREAGLTANELSKLQEMPWAQYYDLAGKAARKLREESGAQAGFGAGFGPVMDGSIVAQHPLYPEASPLAEEVPMMFCTTFYEGSPSRYDPKLENITIGEVHDRLKDRFKDKTNTIVEAYAKTFPDKKPIELFTLISSNRQNVITAADAKAKQKSPVYVAWFGWLPPLFDNRLRSFHCSDICFWFYNTDVMLSHTGGGARPRKLSSKMAGSLLNFMKSGNPNGGGLPSWTKYSVENKETMILNDLSELRNDPDGPARKMLA